MLAKVAIFRVSAGGWVGKVGGRNEELGIRKEKRGIRNRLSNNRNSTIKLAAAGCDETRSAKGLPETRKPQASD